MKHHLGEHVCSQLMALGLLIATTVPVVVFTLVIYFSSTES
jgi:hypothetical protein